MTSSQSRNFGPFESPDQQFAKPKKIGRSMGHRISMLILLWFLMGIQPTLLSQNFSEEMSVALPFLPAPEPELDSLNKVAVSRDPQVYKVRFVKMFHKNGRLRFEGFQCLRKYDSDYFKYFSDKEEVADLDTVPLHVGWSKEYTKKGTLKHIKYVP